MSRGFGWVGIERMKAPSGEVRSAHSGAEKLAPHKRRDIAREAVARGRHEPSHLQTAKIHVGESSLREERAQPSRQCRFRSCFF